MKPPAEKQGFATAKRVLLLILWSILSSQSSNAQETHSTIPLCHRVFLRHPFEPSLNAVERRLICGDTGEKEPFRDVWSYIPPAQAEFQLKASLQSRGYLQAQFHREGDRLWVDPGPLTFVTAIEVQAPDPLSLEIERKRDWLGRKLTPEILNQMERWVLGRSQNLGHPCPVVSSQGDPLTGIVRLSLLPGPQLALKEVIESDASGTGGLMPGTLRRYDAFDIGAPFQGDLLALTEGRILSSQILQNIHLSVARCDPDGAVIRQEAIAGAPRLLAFGFGINTEGILLLRSSWKNTRMGPEGSSMELVGFTSSREQNIFAHADWYYLPYPSRIHLTPNAQLRHQNEQFFEIFSGSASIAHARSWEFFPRDFSGLAASLQVGPKFEYINTIRGAEERNSTFLFLESTLTANSHYFEFHKASPRTGLQGRLTVDLSQKDLLSSTSAQRFQFAAEGLWNFRNYEPYLWILGLRTGASTTLTQERAPFDQLPPTLRNYLGGSSNLRGFSKFELPPNGYGSLTSVFLDIESRFGSFLPFHLEPLAFLDMGLLGGAPLKLDSELYWSPGMGFRWESPVGVLRGTAAHGFVTTSPDSRIPTQALAHWQFYLSLGEEF
jgi:hypothetical protein